MSRDGRCAAVCLRTKGLISCENSVSESKVQAQIRIESKANEGWSVTKRCGRRGDIECVYARVDPLNESRQDQNETIEKEKGVC